jgi:hypothetical protein
MPDPTPTPATPAINDLKATQVYKFICGNVIAVFLYIFAITFFPIPEGNKGTVNIVLGVLLGSVLTSCIGYYVISSPSHTPAPGTQSITLSQSATPPTPITTAPTAPAKNPLLP